MKNRTIHFLSMLLAVALLGGGGGCNAPQSVDDYLVRVGAARLAAAEYERALEAALAESLAAEGDIAIEQLNDLRVRVLNQLTDELIIAQRAQTLGIGVSEEEIDQAVAMVKADYPDDTFETTLLENVVSFAEWKKKLALRLLIDKVIAKELVDKVQIDGADVAAYYQSHFSDTPPADSAAVRQRIVAHLRRQKAEEGYKAWMDELRKAYPVQVNQELWNRLMHKPLAPQTTKMPDEEPDKQIR